MPGGWDILLNWGRRKLWQKERERKENGEVEGREWLGERRQVKGGDDDGWECRFWVQRQSKQPSKTATRTASPSLGKIQRRWRCTRGRCRVQGGVVVVSLGRVTSVVRVRCAGVVGAALTRRLDARLFSLSPTPKWAFIRSDTTTSSFVITIILYTLYYRFITTSARYSQPPTTVQSPVAIFRAAKRGATGARRSSQRAAQERANHTLLRRTVVQ
jgi:hypothetical protein